jgi:DNA-binding response OmpR family regulator/anti-sigma regulatory factor (Ser/Thr protein kinase)
VTQPSTILIVDDAPEGRNLLERLLASEGYTLAFAGDGVEALAKAATLTPDLILMDVMMPHMNGFEVCQRLRADSVLAKVPVILITALDDRAARLHGLEVGADDFVTKPFDEVELLTRVRTITQVNRYRQFLLERAKFEWVVENTDEGYLIVNNDDEVLYANQQARLYLGLAVDYGEPIAKKFLTLARKRYTLKPETAWRIWPEPAVKQTQRYLIQPESTSAHAFWLQVDLFPAEPERSWVVRLRDVTRQVTAQRDMRGFHEMVSHKLRTPLMGMQLSLEMLVHHANELPSDEVADIAGRALRGVQRLQGQIKDILQYLDVANLVRSGGPFNLALLPIVVADISKELGLNRVNVVGQKDLDEAYISLSPQAVELIFREILENAQKFHPQRAPSIEITVACLLSNQARLTISDDGLTLTPEQVAQVWNPYYQGEKDFTGESPGMGLGLPLVASLIWEASGTAYLYNREDRPGVVVELLVPLAWPENTIAW